MWTSRNSTNTASRSAAHNARPKQSNKAARNPAARFSPGASAKRPPPADFEIAPNELTSDGPDDRAFIEEHSARYRRNEAAVAFADNLCVLALPPLLTDVEIFSVLSNVPVRRTPEFYSLPAHIRRDAVADARELFVATDENVKNFGVLLTALRRSYLNRHPGNKETMRFISALASVNAENVTQANTRYLPRLSRSGGGSMGLLMVGAPGSGKTSLYDRLDAYVGNSCVIFHRTLEGRPCCWPQLAFVRVEVPETKTVKALAGAIAAQIDALAHTHLHDTLADKRNPGYYLVKTTQILSAYMVGMVIIDDLQHLATARGDATPLLNWLGTLMEITGIPVVLVATYRVLRIVHCDSGIGSKLTSGGKLSADFLPLGVDYYRLLKAAWSLRVSHPDSKMPVRLPAICHKYTAGNRRFTREYLEALFIAMSRMKDEAVSTKFLEDQAHKVLEDKHETVAAVHKLKNGLPLTQKEIEQHVDFLDLSCMAKRTRVRP